MMSHRISKTDALKKYERDMENRKLIRRGIPISSRRLEKKRKKMLTRRQRFIEMLQSRGGYYKQKENKKEK